MKEIITSKVYYEIQEKLGEGLTSEVYRAFRLDPRGWTRQEVALKIIKSKKDIQILKKEFEQLLKVRSKYCVRVIAWERLQKGPALVLEFLSGLTLEKIHQSGNLTEDLAGEVLAQALLGLKALHREGLVHGDLNLKNIMVTHEGVIKLIDFGFFQNEEQTTWVTPHFASKRVINGKHPEPEDDLYSLIQIQKLVLPSKEGKNNVLGSDPSGCSKLDQKQMGSKTFRRRSLAKIVNSLLSSPKLSNTQILHQPPMSLPQRRFFRIFLIPFVFTLVLIPWNSDSVENFGMLRVTGMKWIRFSINDLPYYYAPLQISLRPGSYQLRWTTNNGKKQKQIQISSSKTFLLQSEK